MKRRNFIQLSGLAGLGLSLPASALLNSCVNPGIKDHSPEFRKLCFDLLKDWCDGMISVQIMNPTDPAEHGLLKCPACDVVHARLLDAVYPFLHMAKATGEQKYLDAGIAAFEWGENVTGADGSWTVIPNPKTWKGITVFGAISLAEALKYHGDLLDEDRRQKWLDRLGRAGDFVYNLFPAIDSTNVNYGATNIYALYLIGGILDKPEFIQRSKELAGEVKSYFTKPNYLLYGEIKPSVHKLSAKGLHGIDLGYNVEESLNAIVMYALQEKDEELLQIVIKSLNGHLEFMLPDGAWDNSWGTRQFKWTYWGSRTSDGCSPAYGMMAEYNPAFGTAAVKNTELLKRCTDKGLLHGGPHYVSHGIKPCVHHTFAHAKPLAFMLDHWDHLPEINTSKPLPRMQADGIKYYEEIDSVLFARGNWRGTVSAYDAEYHYEKDFRQATGGALSVLYHNKIGLLLSASMAEYKLVEKNNQQPAPGKDIALTPRVEVFFNNEWYTNLFDLEAKLESTDDENEIEILSHTKLKNQERKILDASASEFEISYSCSKDILKLTATTKQQILEQTSLVIPVISPTGEIVTQVGENEINIQKPGGLVRIESSVPVSVKHMTGSRTFNMVPGVEAVPIIADFSKNVQQVEISIQVSTV
jgi:hypothetical protein